MISVDAFKKCFQISRYVQLIETVQIVYYLCVYRTCLAGPLNKQFISAKKIWLFKNLSLLFIVHVYSTLDPLHFSMLKVTS